MNEKGREIELNGKKYRMVYTTAAMLMVAEKYGDVKDMAEQAEKNMAESGRIATWLVSTLCNQGTYLDTNDPKPSNPDLISPEWVALHTMPKDWEYLMGECMAAIGIGNGTYHEAPKEGPVDVVLEELEKNAEAGGV